jgi:cobalamin-dependent methionine synthase I
MLAEKAEPVLQQWIERCLQEQLLKPRVAYGYFPCGRSGNSRGAVRPSGHGRQVPRLQQPGPNWAALPCRASAPATAIASPISTATSAC